MGQRQTATPEYILDVHYGTVSYFFLHTHEGKKTMLALMKPCPDMQSSTIAPSFLSFQTAGHYPRPAFVQALHISRCVAFWKKGGRTFVLDKDWALNTESE